MNKYRIFDISISTVALILCSAAGLNYIHHGNYGMGFFEAILATANAVCLITYFPKNKNENNKE